MPTLFDIYESMQKREEDAYATNLARKAKIEEIYATQLGMYEPGGAFEKASLGELEKTKVRDVGATAQRDIGRGLYGIRPYEQEWESNVGAPARLKLEDIMQQRRAAVLGAQAGFLERIEEPYPDYSNLMNAFASAGAAGTTQPRTTTTIMGNTYGASSFPDMFGIGSGGTSGVSPVSQSYQDVLSSVQANKIAAQKAYEAKYPTQQITAPSDYTTKTGTWSEEELQQMIKQSGSVEPQRDTSQEAFKAAKAAGKPWTYNYATWLNAIKSGKA